MADITTKGVKFEGINPTFDGDVGLADSKKLQFGTGNDLQLYHDGSNNYIKSLTGWLNMPISQNGVSIANADFSASIARFLLGGACELYHNGTKRIETTNTGVDVTGALGVTNINMTGILDISATYPRINLNDTNHEDDWSIINDDGSFKIYNVDDSVDSLKIDGSNNATFKGSTDDYILKLDTNNNALSDSAKIVFNDRGYVGWDGFVTLTDYGQNKDLRLRVNLGNIYFQTDNSTRMTIEHTTGDVGIGITPTQKLHVDGHTLISAEKYYYVAGSGAGLGSDASGNLILRQNSANLMTTSGSNATFAGTVTAPSFIGTASNAALLDNIDSNLFANFCNLTFVDSSEQTVRSTSYPTPARSNNPDPNDYGRVFHTEMKQRSSIGAVIGGSCYWAGLVSMAPYSGSTNWYTTQITFGADGTSDKLLTRRGTGTSWGDWREIITSDSATFTENVNITGTNDLIIANGSLTSSQSSTTNPVARFTNTGTNHYDWTFPDNSTLQLGSSVGTDLIFKLLNAGSGDFNLDVGGDVTVAGNLTVSGTTTTINTTTVEVKDNILQLNTTQGTGGNADTATAATSGISVYRGDGVSNAFLVFDDADDTWDLSHDLVVAGKVGVGMTAVDKLEVAGNIRANVSNAGGFMLTANSASGLVRNNATGLALRTNTTDRLIINNSGNATFTGTVTANGTLLTGNTGTVTGTGVDNRLALWNGTTAIDSDSDFYVSASTLHTTALQITSDNAFYRETINSNTGGESWIAGNGWHRIIEISGGSGRGKCHFLIQTGGGSGTPCRFEAIVNTAWSNANATLSILHNSYPNFITDIRVVRNTTSNKAFVDIKGGGEDYVSVTILPAGSTSAALVNFTNVNTLPTGDSKQIEKTITGKIMSLAAGTGSDTSGWRPFQVGYDGSMYANVVTAYSPSGNAYAANFLSSTGSGYAKFYQDSNNHMSLYMTNSSGTNNVVLNSSGVSYIKGGNLIVGGSADSGEMLQVEGTGAFTGNLETQGAFTVRDASSNHQIKIQPTISGTSRIMAHNTNIGTNHDLDIVSTQIDLQTGSISGSDNSSALLLDSSRNATFAGTLNIGAGQKIYLGGSTARMHVYHTGSSGEATVLTKEGNLNLVNQSHGDDIIFKTEDSSGNVVTPLTLDSAGDATFAGDILSSTTSKQIKSFRRWQMDANNDYGINNASGTQILLISGGGTPSTSTAAFSGNVTITGGTLNLGNDVSIYDDGANILRTDDIFHANNDIHIGGAGKIFDRAGTGTWIQLDHPNMTFTTPSGTATFTGDITQVDGKRIWFRGSSASSGTGAQSYIHSDGLNLKIKGDDNVRILGDGGGTIAHFDYTGKVGIGTESPATRLSNTATRIGNADGLTTHLSGLNWIVDGQGYAAAISNLEDAANNHTAGLLVEIAGTDATDKILDLESGGVNRFRMLGTGDATFAGNVSIADTKYLNWGQNNDFKIHHNGSASYLQNYVGTLAIQNNQNDGNIVFQSDDGNGGLFDYFSLDGGGTTYSHGATTAAYTKWQDNSRIALGSGHDLQLYHDGTNSQIRNLAGSLDFEQHTNDGNIRFYNDDGNGGAALYYYLAGAEATYSGGATTALYTIWQDNSRIALGSGKDLQIYHDGTNNFIRSVTSTLYIKNEQDDGDIRFESDDGSGNIAEYFRVDGGAVKTIASKNFAFIDDVQAEFGDSGDLQIYHAGSDSYIKDAGTGNLLITSDGASVQINKGTTENMAEFITDGAVKLYYDSARKFETTNTGIQVTGYSDFASTGSGYGFKYGTSPGDTQGIAIKASDTGGSYFDGLGYFWNNNTGNGAGMFQMQNDGNTYCRYINFFRGSNSNIIGYIGYNSSNTAVTYSTSSSDERLKKNIVAWNESVLPKFLSLQPKKFNFKAEVGDPGPEKIKGYIAQNEVANFPEVYQLNGEGDDARYGFHPMEMVPYLMKAVKELVEKNQDLEARIVELEK